jgi:hypothetical protein
MNGIGAHTGQTYIQTFIFIYIDVCTQAYTRGIYEDGMWNSHGCNNEPDLTFLIAFKAIALSAYNI